MSQPAKNCCCSGNAKKGAGNGCKPGMKTHNEREGGIRRGTELSGCGMEQIGCGCIRPPEKTPQNTSKGNK